MTVNDWVGMCYGEHLGGRGAVRVCARVSGRNNGSGLVVGWKNGGDGCGVMHGANYGGSDMMMNNGCGDVVVNNGCGVDNGSGMGNDGVRMLNRLRTGKPGESAWVRGREAEDGQKDDL